MTPQPHTPPVTKSPHSFKHKLLRLLWAIVQSTLFRLSPRPCHRWRNLLLRLFGADLHPTARIYPRAKVWAPWNLTMGPRATIADDVDCYAVERITLEERVVVSQYTYLCGATHDFELSARPLIPMPITIGQGTWIAADVFVAPGVTIGKESVVGARSSVFTDLPDWKVCIGSPAKPVRDRTMKDQPDASNTQNTNEAPTP